MARQPTKRGLVPHKTDGPVLVDGTKYTLRVDSAFQDAKGRALKTAFVKDYTATTADCSQPEPKKWKVTAPKRGTREALVVKLDQPIDHGMLMRMIQVLGSDGGAYPGNPAVSDGETTWTYTPDEEWTDRDYFVSIDTLLEDAAGNSIARQFELVRGETLAPTNERFIDIPFICKY